MTISLADLDGWDPDAINAVFTALLDNSEATRQTSQGLGRVLESVPWEGEAYAAASTAGKGIQRDLDLHAGRLEAVADAARVAEAEIRAIKADWQQICRLSDRWGIMIDVDAGTIVPPSSPPTDPAEAAELRRRMDVVHDGIVDLLVRADTADRDLAAAINGATGAMTVDEVNAEIADSPPVRPDQDEERTRNQEEAFERLYGRAPVSTNDWQMAAALDAHSYSPKYRGVAAEIVAGRFTPQPGRGVVRTNLFIPADQVQNVAMDLVDVRDGRWLPMNYGDGRGPSATADPEASRVSVYVDYDAGVVAVRQNPTVNVDGGRGGAAVAVPRVHAAQAPDGRITIDYDANDAYENPAGIAAGLTVNGRMTLNPEPGGAISLGGRTTIYPSMETYQYRDGQQPALVGWNPANSGSPWGPATSLMRHHEFGDAAIPAVRPDVSPRPWLPGRGVPVPGDGFVSHTTRLTDPAGGVVPVLTEGR